MKEKSMSKPISIRDKCEQLLAPKDTLDMSIFDKNNKIYPHIKQALLDYTKFIISKTVDIIPGLKIEDICLSDSLSSYFYDDKSVINVRILVKNENCDFITKNDNNLTRFLAYIKSVVIMNQKFTVNKRFVNVNFTTHNIKFLGTYSLLGDKWLNSPSKEVTATLNVDDMMNEYTEKFHAIKEHLSLITQSGEILTLKGVKNLERYYEDLLITAESSIKEYLIYQMLKYSGIITEMNKTFSQNLKRCLSIE